MTDPSYNTGNAIDTALVRQNYGGPVGLTAESAVMGLCDEIDRLRLDLRSEQMERADADQEVGRLRALADPAPVGLTEKELRLVSDARELAPPNPDYPIPWDRYLLARLVAIIDRLSAAPVDDRERLAELEDWLLSAEHHAGCSGEYKNPDGAWAYRCKCGLRELRDERPVSPSVDPEEEP